MRGKGGEGAWLARHVGDDGPLDVREVSGDQLAARARAHQAPKPLAITLRGYLLPVRMSTRHPASPSANAEVVRMDGPDAVCLLLRVLEKALAKCVDKLDSLSV